MCLLSRDLVYLDFTATLSLQLKVYAARGERREPPFRSDVSHAQSEGNKR